MSNSYYSCNGSPKGCERERFGMCAHCDPENSPTFEDFLAGANERADRDYDDYHRSIGYFTYTEAVERYRNDVVFKSLVDAMRMAVRHNIVSLNDYKQAIALAEAHAALSPATSEGGK